MVDYLIIGIIVALVETIMTLVDLKKMGMTVYDLCPDTEHGFAICVLIILIAITTFAWPVQVYHWIRRIVRRKEVQ
jgi:hypothetical protein